MDSLCSLYRETGGVYWQSKEVHRTWSKNIRSHLYSPYSVNLCVIPETRAAHRCVNSRPHRCIGSQLLWSGHASLLDMCRALDHRGIGMSFLKLAHLQDIAGLNNEFETKDGKAVMIHELLEPAFALENGC